MSEHKNHCDYLVLGQGYSGKVLSEMLAGTGTVITTSRTASDACRFDLNEPETWPNLPDARHTVWMFPAQPLDKVTQFIAAHRKRLGRLVVLGTTGAIITETEHQWVDEHSPLNMEMERVRGELALRDEGAMLMLAAGIYGPGRNPLDWVRRGLVGPSDRYLNLIHVDDLCGLTMAAWGHGDPGHTYIAADGRPSTWADLYQRWRIEYGVNVTEGKVSRRSSKRCDSKASLSRLGFQLRFPDVLAGIASIEGGHMTSRSL